MQLNSLTFNSSTDSPQSKSQLAIYEHKAAIINTQIFVFGKILQNYSIQTPIQKLNMKTLRAEPVYTVNAPVFQEFIMFTFQKFIYFFGKTLQKQENQLFQFDGYKFVKMTQTGRVPNLSGPYSYTIFSHKYLLLFSSLNEYQLLNKWYIFDIQKLLWQQLVSNILIPISQKSSLIWVNGRGYLLLKLAYLQNTKKLRKNLLYEIKFKNKNHLYIQCEQISISPQLQNKNFLYTQLISCDEKYLIILGGEQIQNQNQNQTNQQKINFDFQKIVYNFNLELFQWSNQIDYLPIKGQNHQILVYGNMIFFIGGILGNKSINQIQIFEHKRKKQSNNFDYEQSICYNCESAFTYKQNLIYQAIVQKEYDGFLAKAKIESKLIKKLSETISNEIKSIGILIQFFMFQKPNYIKLNLCQFFGQQTFVKKLKSKIQFQTSQFLVIKSQIYQLPKLQTLKGVFQISHPSNNSKQLSQFYFNFTQLKLACFKLGYAFIYVTFTQQKQIFVMYSSYSQTDLPQSNLRDTSQVFYTIKINQSRNDFLVSSELKRKIIFQNVKLYFSKPQDYQNNLFFSKKLNQYQQNNSFVYIVGVNNLQKVYQHLSKTNYLEDIKCSNLSKNNSSNSLRNYLRHLFAFENNKFSIFLQDQQVQLVNIYQKFHSFAKNHQLKQISTSEQGGIKTQLEETHFSTINDEPIIHLRKIQTIEKCRIYEISKKQSDELIHFYDKIFLYRKGKLVKSFYSQKKAICGIVQLIETLQIQLNSKNLMSKREENKLMSWLNQIENALIETTMSNSCEA